MPNKSFAVQLCIVTLFVLGSVGYVCALRAVSQKISPRTNTRMYYVRAMQEQLPRHGATEERQKRQK
jgi:Trk-type K+ transport system membrane component